MLSFMAVWILLMSLVVRGTDRYFVGQSTLAEATLEGFFYKTPGLQASKERRT